METDNLEFLGDSLYVCYDGNEVAIKTTDKGRYNINLIILNKKKIAALVDYLRRMGLMPEGEGK